MRDVAASAGVSLKTVSRVFNDDPRVRDETRARVESAMRELNYLPNELATTFRSGKTRAVGVAVPDLLDPFFAAVVKAVDGHAGQRRCATIVTSLGSDGAREPSIVKSLLGLRLVGLVIAPIAPDQSYLAPFVASTPTVFVDRPASGVAADSFLDDDFTGAYRATEHLLGHGCRRVAFVAETPHLSTTRNRLAGYRRALEDHGHAVDGGLSATDVTDRSRAAAAVRAFLSRGRVDGIFSCSPRTSMALVPALKGLTIALVGFGDFPMADALAPAVTVVDQDPQTMGRLAAQRVFERAERPHRRYRRRTVLPVAMVERESCLGGSQREDASHGGRVALTAPPTDVETSARGAGRTGGHDEGGHDD